MKKNSDLPVFSEVDPKKIELCQIKGFSPGAWVWCLHCWRCYKVGEFRFVKKYELQLCPYQDCDGSPLDAFLWAGENAPDREKMYADHLGGLKV
jgi:hypothetical protein